MDKLQDIFDRQAAYIKKLEAPMLLNGFLTPEYPLNLDDRLAQEHLRLLAWRINEEVWEAIREIQEDIEPSPGKFREELADVFHFIVELAIAVGVSANQLQPNLSGEDLLEQSFRYAAEEEPPTLDSFWNLMQVLAALSIMMYGLRQRPWRLDNRPTDVNRLRGDLHTLYNFFIRVCIADLITANDLYNIYIGKSAINHRRQETP